MISCFQIARAIAGFIAAPKDLLVEVSRPRNISTTIDPRRQIAAFSADQPPAMQRRATKCNQMQRF
jgi:hypothetical protein